MTIPLAQQILVAERAAGFGLERPARFAAAGRPNSWRRFGSRVLRSTARFGLRVADRLDPELELAA